MSHGFDKSLGILYEVKKKKKKALCGDKSAYDLVTATPLSIGIL
jgi:hypothetical protein